MDEKEALRNFRKKMFLTAYPSKTAHLASAFSIAEIMYALYVGGILRINPTCPDDPERDRLILSKGHGSLAVYAALNAAGFISDARLSTFCRPGYSLGGEVNMLETPGVEATTGSLGHGLGFATGIATALKLNGSSARVFVIVGNGEIQEGVIWESVMSAYKFSLDNLTVILDDNKIQKMGRTDEMMKISSWDERWSAFGWQVEKIKDGHNLSEITSVLSAQNTPGLPRVVIADTVKGKGVSIMENNPDWHFKMPYKRELKYFMQELEITAEELENAKSILDESV